MLLVLQQVPLRLLVLIMWPLQLERLPGSLWWPLVQQLEELGPHRQSPHWSYLLEESQVLDQHFIPRPSHQEGRLILAFRNQKTLIESILMVPQIFRLEILGRKKIYFLI